MQDYHDYTAGQKEWDLILASKTTPAGTQITRCNYCKIPLRVTKLDQPYQRPMSYDAIYNQFVYMPGRQYGHPACILAEITEEAYSCLVQKSFLVHKYLRDIYQHEHVIQRAPPREILVSFGGKMSFQHYGELLSGQQFMCEHVYEPFFIPAAPPARDNETKSTGTGAGTTSGGT